MALQLKWTDQVADAFDAGELDDDVIAKQLLASLSADERQELLARLLAEEVSRMRRERARRIERHSETDQHIDAYMQERERLNAEHDAEWASMADEWTRELLAEPFALGDGRRVQWGRATATEHDQRANYLDQKAKGITRTADKHRRASAQLRELGANCLNELIERPKQMAMVAGRPGPG